MERRTKMLAALSALAMLLPEAVTGLAAISQSAAPTLPGRSLGTGAVAFERNVGQFTGTSAFVAKTPAAEVRLGSRQTLIATPEGRVRMRLDGASPLRWIGEDLLARVSNYLTGSDPSRWHTAVPH